MIKSWKNGEYFHVTFDRVIKRWKVKKVGDLQINTYSNKDEAIKEAIKLAKNSLFGHIVIHDEKGRFVSP